MTLSCMQNTSRVYSILSLEGIMRGDIAEVLEEKSDQRTDGWTTPVHSIMSVEVNGGVIRPQSLSQRARVKI